MEKPYTEADIAHALDLIDFGVSIRRASFQYHIPYKTLWARANGADDRILAHEEQLYLSPALELRLSGWIIKLNRGGVAPTHSFVRSLAAKLKNGDRPIQEYQFPSKNWTTRFIQRHPPLATRKAKRISAQRVEGARKDVLEDHLSRLEHIVQEYHIPPELIVNVDETGIASGIGICGLVVGMRETAAAYAKQGGDRSWKSIMHGITAAGNALKPVVVFKGPNQQHQLQQQWFPLNKSDIPDWEFSVSESGSSTSAHLHEWLQKVFLKEVVPADPEQWRLLILDGHQTHIDIDFILECLRNHVFLYYLPAHTSHVSQPLDVGVFSSLKTTYRQYYTKLAGGHDGQAEENVKFLQSCFLAFPHSFTYNNIIAGFRAAGIYPLNNVRLLRNPLILDPNNEPPQSSQPRTPSPHINTPHGRNSVHKSVLAEDESIWQQRRKGRKVMKFVDSLIAENVQLKSALQHLEEKEAQRQEKRKAVQKQNPNDIFTSQLEIFNSHGSQGEGEGIGQAASKAESGLETG